MKKTSKKGFTIVELVIVIAVVAILAAVLIPTFVSITKKANESKDTQLVRNLNTALATDVGVEHETMTSALNAAAKAGYDVAKINTSATDNEILWDSANDVFCYRKDGEIQYIPETSLKIAKEEVESYQYWIISSTVDSKYSTYLRDGYEGAKIENLTTGLDVGNNTGITEISYNRSSAGEGQTVVIRTNGGTLNINAQKDTVHHYDYIKTLSVDAVSSKNCYHEHGFVGELAKFASGKFVAASTAEFHQTRLTIEETIASAKNATFEDLGVTYGSHHFSDGSCTYCEKGDTDINVTLHKVEDLKKHIEGLGEAYDGTVKYSLGDDLEFNKDIVIVQPRMTGMLLDLKGHTLTLYNSKYDETKKCFTTGLIVRGYFEVIDSSADKTGKIVASSNADNDGDGGLITVVNTGGRGSDDEINAELVLTNGTIDATANNACAIMMSNSGCVTINGGIVKANGYAISGSESDGSYYKGRLVIAGGEITSLASYAIYHPQYFDTGKGGKFEISGGTIEGAVGVIKMGGATPFSASSCTDLFLNIIEGNFISHGDHIVYINAICNKGDTQKVKVSGGKFSNENSGYFCKVEKTSGTKNSPSSTYLSGGTYKNISKDNFMQLTTGTKYKAVSYSTGYTDHDNGDGTWSVIKK